MVYSGIGHKLGMKNIHGIDQCIPYNSPDIKDTQDEDYTLQGYRNLFLYLPEMMRIYYETDLFDNDDKRYLMMQ
jgi:hypothetical protein